MDFQSEDTKKLVFVCFLFSQVLIISSIPDYIFITQPPTELLCNPHSTAISDIGLECSIGIIGKDQLPVETRIVWFRRTPSNSTNEQLCETDISFSVATSPFTSARLVMLRSTVHLRETLLGDLTGEYWCRVAKTIKDGRTALSNNSSVLSINSSRYYNDNELNSCNNGTIFLDYSAISLDISGTSHQSVDFISSSITTEKFLCPLQLGSSCTESDNDSLSISRMRVYILAPVIAAVLILIFLSLVIALIITCIKKRDSTKKHPSTIGLSANIELDPARNADTQIKSNGLSVGNATFVDNIRSDTQTPTTKSSSTHLEHSKQILNKQKPLQQQEEKQTGAQYQNSDNEEYYYTHVPSRNGRNAAEVLGRLKGACTGVQLGSSAPVKSGSDDDDAGNLEYHSLDPEGLEPAHTYHAMQLSALDGPRPACSEPGVRAGHRKPVLAANGHRPSPPTKIPPRAHARKNKRPAHVPVRSVPNVDGEYVHPNNQKSQLYQGLTPERKEYLALYMTPDSSPH